ncbi:MAG: CDP-alcohol phosphatidyltransferase family protein [Candidatus Omnitrophica bacterium]|nr:CDP-alcohol phosphatidyltransferase family protein [Candidatus Omnitrophota bacterium]
MKKKIDNFVSSVANTVFKEHVSADLLTLFTFIFGIIAGWFFFYGRTFLGGITILISGFFDTMDGAVARKQGSTTKFGAFWDSTLDRYSELFIYGGILLFFTKTSNTFGTTFTYLTIIGATLTSYTRARAEGLNIDCKVGILTRAPRVIILIIGSMLGFLIQAMFIVAILSNITAIQRIWHVFSVTRKS